MQEQLIYPFDASVGQQGYLPDSIGLKSGLFGTRQQNRQHPEQRQERAQRVHVLNAVDVCQVPQQRRTVRRVYRVGRTEKEVSMLTHSTNTRASVDDFRLHMQHVPTDKMRRALLAAKLLHAGSTAPEPLVRRIYHQRQLLVGDLVVK